MAIDKIQVGNIVYKTNYGNVRVLEISSDGNNYLIEDSGKSQSWNNKKELAPIILEEKHLLDIGFQENNKIFQNNNMQVSRLGYVEGSDLMNLKIVDLGFRVLPNGFVLTSNIEEIEG